MAINKGSDNENVVNKIDGMLYFYGFARLGDRVEMQIVLDNLILRSADSLAEPSFVLNRHTTDDPDAIACFDACGALGYLFSDMDGEYFQTDVYYEVDSADFYKQFPHASC